MREASLIEALTTDGRIGHAMSDVLTGEVGEIVCLFRGGGSAYFGKGKFNANPTAEHM